MSKKLSAKKLKADGIEMPEPAAPPIIIVSDGTSEGTQLLVYGELVEFKRMDMYCNKEDDYSSCSMSITMSEAGQDGISVERTLTLRKSKQDY